MWSFSKLALRVLACMGLLTLLFVTGCMSDTPSDTDMPWAAPASWEGTMPLPSSYLNRYE